MPHEQLHPAIFPDKKRLNEFANRVFEAQVLSLKQKNKYSKWSDLLYITYKKGGESLLFYRCSFSEKISEQEIECLSRVGGLIQVCNDIFDDGLAPGVWNPIQRIDHRQL